jgi:hypothetical protein
VQALEKLPAARTYAHIHTHVATIMHTRPALRQTLSPSEPIAHFPLRPNVSQSQTPSTATISAWLQPVAIHVSAVSKLTSAPCMPGQARPHDYSRPAEAVPPGCGHLCAAELLTAITRTSCPHTLGGMRCSGGLTTCTCRAAYTLLLCAGVCTNAYC